MRGLICPSFSTPASTVTQRGFFTLVLALSPTRAGVHPGLALNKGLAIYEVLSCFASYHHLRGQLLTGGGWRDGTFYFTHFLKSRHRISLRLQWNFQPTGEQLVISVHGSTSHADPRAPAQKSRVADQNLFVLDQSNYVLAVWLRFERVLQKTHMGGILTNLVRSYKCLLIELGDCGRPHWEGTTTAELFRMRH